MNFSGYVDYDAWSKLEHFEDAVLILLDTGFVFQFSGSKFVLNITGGEWILIKF